MVAIQVIMDIRRIPDDCTGPKRFTWFTGRSVRQALIIKSKLHVNVQTEKVV